MNIIDLFKRQERKGAGQLLGTVPGPSPWYLRGNKPVRSRKHGDLYWRELAGSDSCTGKVALADHAGNYFLVLDFNCYFYSLAVGRALLWHPAPPGAESPSWTFANMRFALLDLDQFPPIDAVAACDQMKENSSRVAHAGQEFASCLVPTSLPAGTNTYAFPERFKTIGELLVLVHSTADHPSDFFQKMSLCIWSVRPDEDRVDVYPQDWFNHGSYDFMYQWVTRVARDPQTQDVVGDGVRIGVFQLDKSLRHIEKWL